jgi:redox-sensitive bicupin YhaK (pirin superfamily)
MLTLRPADERGRSQLDWLDSQHSFSFDQYFDPKHMSCGPLRVINEDVIAPGGGFGTHPHRDMEIITYVIEGSLQHKDSLGNGSIIKPGEIQKMSAGTGIFHSEFNASQTEPVHLLQIWIVPTQRGLTPKYEQESFTLTPGEFKLLGSNDGMGLITIAQNFRLSALSSEPGMVSRYECDVQATVWLQIVKGDHTINGKSARAGDGLSIQQTASIDMKSTAAGELLLFDMREN